MKRLSKFTLLAFVLSLGTNAISQPKAEALPYKDSANIEF